MSESYNRDPSCVECPVCGYKNDLTESVGARGEDVTEWRCSECLTAMAIRVHISISVTAYVEDGK